MEVNRGLLQGKIMSPGYFNFTSNLDVYLRKKESKEESINRTTDREILMYADDLIVLVDSAVIMNRILIYLHEYCTRFDLEVNLEKING